MNTIGSYQCICAPGYTGDNCTINIDECQQTNECSPNSLCVDGIDSYTCDCNPGYTGALCVDLIDYCEGGPCQNGGTCNNYIGSYGCNCPDGFNGSRCETNINDCDPNPCVNGGSCTDEVYWLNFNWLLCIKPSHMVSFIRLMDSFVPVTPIIRVQPVIQ